MGIEVQRRRLASTIAALDIGPTAPASGSLAALADYERARRRSRTKAVSAARRRDQFPAEPLLLPTGLGNILRAAETSSGERFGLSTVVVFPRLRNVLSSRLDSSLAQLLTQLDTSAALCISFSLSAAISIPLLAQGWGSLVPIAFLALSFLSYRGAKTAAAYHGRLLDVAFDLHRFDLLRTMHYSLPRNPREELDFNVRLSDFLSRRLLAADAMPDAYVHVDVPSGPLDPPHGDNPGESQNA
jgi:hypothetical protein